MAGISSGLFEHLENGKQLFLRDGDGVGTRSRMVLLPEDEMGFFINYNSSNSTLRLDLVSAILDRYYPAELTEASLPAISVENAKRFTGSYRPLQADVTTFGKSMYFFSQQVEIKVDDNGLLLLTPNDMGDEKSSTMGGFEGTSEWIEVAPLQFEQVDGKGRIAFGEDENGRITHLYSGQGYHSAFGRLAWYESQSFQIIMLEVTALLIISMVMQSFMIWPVSLLINKLRQRKNEIVWPEVTARLWAAFVSGLLALFIFRAIGVLYAIDSIGGVPNFVWGVSDEMIGALNAIYLPALMALTLPLLTILAWVRGWWKVNGRVHYTLVTLVTLFLIWWAWYWQLLGYQG